MDAKQSMAFTVANYRPGTLAVIATRTTRGSTNPSSLPARRLERIRKRPRVNR
jgi:hypothetical protein